MSINIPRKKVIRMARTGYSVFPGTAGPGNRRFSQINIFINIQNSGTILHGVPDKKYLIFSGVMEYHSGIWYNIAGRI
jgi:hypothetical protein